MSERIDDINSKLTHFELMNIPITQSGGNNLKPHQIQDEAAKKLIIDIQGDNHDVLNKNLNASEFENNSHFSHYYNVTMANSVAEASFENQEDENGTNGRLNQLNRISKIDCGDSTDETLNVTENEYVEKMQNLFS